MATQKPTIAQVISSANAARQHLGALERELQEGIDAIDFEAFKAGRCWRALKIDQKTVVVRVEN